MAAVEPFSIPGFADPFSSISHLAGAAVFAVLSVPLIRKGIRAHGAAVPALAGHEPPGWPRVAGHVASLAIFAASAVVQLSLSGVYHLLARGNDQSGGGVGRAVLQRLDHAAIFVLIAGTFTPVHAILFRGPWRWGMLAFIWAFTAAGVTLKSVFFRSTPEWLGLALYIGMGWIGMVSIVVLARRLGVFGDKGVWPLAAGGLVYTAGAVIDGVKAPVLIPGVLGSHELFHLAVLAGLSLQWWFVWRTADVRTAAT